MPAFFAAGLGVVLLLAAIIRLVSAGFDAFNSGREQAEKSKVHKQGI